MTFLVRFEIIPRVDTFIIPTVIDFQFGLLRCTGYGIPYYVYAIRIVSRDTFRARTNMLFTYRVRRDIKSQKKKHIFLSVKII